VVHPDTVTFNSYPPGKNHLPCADSAQTLATRYQSLYCPSRLPTKSNPFQRIVIALEILYLQAYNH